MNLKYYVIKYSKKITLYNELINCHNSKMQKCCDQLGKIVSIKDRMSDAVDIEERISCETQLKTETENYITLRKSIKNLDENLSQIADEISQIERNFKKRQLGKLKETIIIKEKNYVEQLINMLDKEIEQVSQSSGLKNDIINLIHKKDLKKVIETEFDLNKKEKSYNFNRTNKIYAETIYNI